MEKIELRGSVFGRLTVVGQNGLLNRKPAWECRCQCGVVKTLRGDDLRAGKVLSCGCLRNERVREAISTHGDASRSGKRPEYNVWLAMRSRCGNPKNKDFPDYGGRGVSVCKQWQESYASFIQDMGVRPSPKHTLERDDVNGNYTPDNCRWATWAEQRRNTRAYIAKHGGSNA